MNDKDMAFVDALTRNTEKGLVKWEPTAIGNQLTTSFKGKYNIIVTGVDGAYTLEMRDQEDHEMLKLTSLPGEWEDYTPQYRENESLRELFPCDSDSGEGARYRTRPAFPHCTGILASTGAGHQIPR